MVDRKHLIELIPWYLNGTLSEKELDEVDDFVTNDPEGKFALDEWMRIRLLVHSEERKLPPEGIEVRIFDRIRSQSAEQLGLFHPYALGLSLVILVLLWAIIRPGVILRWKVADDEIISFRIFRSEQSGNNYRFLDELPVGDSGTVYSYVDLFIWPLNDYIYYVEGINATGSSSISQVISSPALIALPGQLALICASFFIGYGIVLLIRYRQILLIGNTRLTAV